MKSNCGRPPRPKQAVRQFNFKSKSCKKRCLKPLNRKKRNSFIIDSNCRTASQEGVCFGPPASFWGIEFSVFNKVSQWCQETVFYNMQPSPIIYPAIYHFLGFIFSGLKKVLVNCCLNVVSLKH
jgi:hypothetical protein